MSNPVEQLVDEYKIIKEACQRDISSVVLLNKHFRKAFFITAGVYFEHKITTIISDFVQRKSDESNDEWIKNFLKKNTAIKYFQLFDWGKSNTPDCQHTYKDAKVLFNFFGDEFKKQIETDVEIKKADSEKVKFKKKQLREAIESFLNVGHLRNISAHNNSAEKLLESVLEQKSIEELFSLFRTVEPFLDYLREKLKQ